MAKRAKKRYTKTARWRWLVSVGFALTLAAGLLMYGLRENISYFYYPSQIARMAERPTSMIRLGGVVGLNSVRQNTDHSWQFTIRDQDHEIAVRYQGAIPALFREGQGVIADGQLQEDGTFQAIRVLAKHDENYRPPDFEKYVGTTNSPAAP